MSGIVHALRRIEDLQADDVPVLVVIENDARLVLVALVDWRLAEEDPQSVGFRVVRYFHKIISNICRFCWFDTPSRPLPDRPDHRRSRGAKKILPPPKSTFD